MGGNIRCEPAPFSALYRDGIFEMKSGVQNQSAPGKTMVYPASDNAWRAFWKFSCLTRI